MVSAQCLCSGRDRPSQPSKSADISKLLTGSTSCRVLLLIITGVALLALSYAAAISPSSLRAAGLPKRLDTTIRTFLGIRAHDDDDDEGNVQIPDDDEGNVEEFETRVRGVLEKAAMPNRTVIITTLNGAWAMEGSMINMFLESFWNGDGTQRLLQHLVFVCVDKVAYERCLVIHPHCLIIKTSGVNLSEKQVWLSANYIKLVWRRIKFLKTVLELNYNFLFTDTDSLWFRDPFPSLQKNAQIDIQISSDLYNGNPSDLHNEPNSGFMYVRANERTIKFHTFWYEKRKRDPMMATQGIFNLIKFDDEFKEIGMNLHFLDPKYFSGFCNIGKADMASSITMHATCCKGLEPKLIDLRKMLDRWKEWQLISPSNSKKYKSPFQNKQDVSERSKPCDAHMNVRFQKPIACSRSFQKKRL